MALFREPMTDQATSKRKLSWRRKSLFSFVALVFGLFLLEFLAWLFLTFRVGPYSFQSIYHSQSQLAASGRDEVTAREVLHPYFGWTFDPDSDSGSTFFDSPVFPVNDFGFPDEGSSLVKRENDHLSIAILGGSFAHELSLSAGERIVEILRQEERFRDKQFRIVRLAMSGYKQPQQLMIINYMFAIGAEYDYVVNLDGFNEAVLPVRDNRRAAVNYSYPRSWHARMKDVVDPESTSISFRLLTIRAQRQACARWITSSLWRRSSLANLLWRLRDDLLKLKLLSLEGELLYDRMDHGRPYVSGGPPRQFETEEDRYAHMVDLWAKSSVQMHAVCQANGAVYLHFFQPNQYLPDSKPLTEAELESAFAAEGFEERTMVELNYPLFRERGQELANQGVNFIDLTQLFAGSHETYYRDQCCHLNPAGYDVVAEAIAKEIIKTP